MIITVQSGESIQDAVTAASDGDVVEVSPGTYNEQVIVSTPVILKSKVPRTCFVKRGIYPIVNNVEIDGFVVEDLPNLAFGVPVSRRPVNRIIIRNCVARRCVMGIIADGEDWGVFNNEVDTPKLWQTSAPRRGDADYARFFGRRHVYRGNYFHGANTLDACLPDVTSYNATECAHVDGWQTFTANREEAFDIWWDQNYFADASNGLIFTNNRGPRSDPGALLTVHTWRITNNVFESTQWTSEGVFTKGIVTAGVSNVTVKNNTFINLSTGVAIMDVAPVTGTGRIGANLFVNVKRIYGNTNQSNVEIGNNIESTTIQTAAELRGNNPLTDPAAGWRFLQGANTHGARIPIVGEPLPDPDPEPVLELLIEERLLQIFEVPAMPNGGWVELWLKVREKENG